MALTFEFCKPRALAAGCTLVNFSINAGPKLALTVHEVSATATFQRSKNLMQAGAGAFTENPVGSSSPVSILIRNEWIELLS